MKLKLKNTSGESVTLIIKPEDTFIDLRERVAEELGLRLDLSDIVNGEKYLETQRVLDFFSQLPQGEESNYTNNNEVSSLECIVPGCNHKKSTHPHLSFFEFPQEELRNHQWAFYCHRLLGEGGKKRLNITSTSRICSVHFKAEHFAKNSSTTLKRTAIPCINPQVNNVTSSVSAHNPLIGHITDNTVTNFLNHNHLERLSSSDFISDNTAQIKKEKEPMCRLCGKLTDTCIYIFEDTDDPICLADKINSCLPIKVDMTGDLPKQICTECLYNLDKLFTFSETSISSHLVLKEKSSRLDQLSTVLAKTEETDGKPSLELTCDFSDETDVWCSGARCTMCGDGNMCPSDLAFTWKHISNDSLQEETFSSEDSYVPKNPLPDTVHSIKQENVNWEAADNAFNFYCNRCCADFKSYSDLLPHSLMHSEEGNYVCVLCDFVCEKKNVLTIHFKTHDFEPSIFQCNICSIEFRSLSLLEMHKCEPTSCSINRCNICLKTFRTESRLEFHKKFHEKTAGQCEYCPKSFNNELKLYKHITYFHGQSKINKGHTCEECGKVFKSLSSLKYHVRVHQGEPSSPKLFSCDICAKSFNRRSILRNHMTISHKTMTIVTTCIMCTSCYEVFPTVDSVCAHIERAHSLESDVTYQSLNSRIFTCEFCTRHFATCAHINNHRNKHRNELPYECKQCSAEFPTLRDLDTHCMNHHSKSICKEYSSEFPISALYVCEYCDRTFVSLVKHSEHQTIHYGPTPYLCRMCEAKYPSYDELYTHKISVHGNSEDPNESNYYRPFDCHYCSKTFSIEDALIKHIRMHTGEKPFICDQCGKAFSQSSGLYTHLKVHSTDRPYTCTLCPRTFKIKGDRDIHVRRHSGERPYKCEFCGKAFMTQHVYSQHRKIHTGERPYKCDVCHISFRRSHVLTVHKRIHTGEKPNTCDLCGKSYRQKGDMIKHKRIQHGYVHFNKQQFQDNLYTAPM